MFTHMRVKHSSPHALLEMRHPDRPRERHTFGIADQGFWRGTLGLELFLYEQPIVIGSRPESAQVRSDSCNGTRGIQRRRQA